MVERELLLLLVLFSGYVVLVINEYMAFSSRAILTWAFYKKKKKFMINA